MTYTRVSPLRFVPGGRGSSVESSTRANVTSLRQTAKGGETAGQKGGRASGRREMSRAKFFVDYSI